LIRYSELVPGSGIYLFKTCASIFGRPLMWTCFLAVDNYIIDTGNARCGQGRLIKILESILPGKPVILNTHLHEDHCGNNSVIQEKLGADIFVPAKKDFSDVTLIYRLFWGRPDRFNCELIRENSYITSSGKKIKAIRTPGHTPEHTSFFIEPDMILFTGDASPLASRKIYLMPEENYIEEIRTLEKIRGMLERCNMVIDGHYGIIDDPAVHLDTRISNMKSTVDMVRLKWAENPGNYTKVAFMALGKPNFYDPFLQPRISTRNTINSIITGTAGQHP